jgi:biotin carboxyl carrier protein
LPGVVKKLFISEGDIVEKGDVLLILEAMKMEQQVLAPCNGSIKNLNVLEGDQVLENQPLLEVEG